MVKKREKTKSKVKPKTKKSKIKKSLEETPKQTISQPTTTQQLPQEQKIEPKPRESDEESTGQFLVTYGWAILVILAGIGALFYLGLSNSGTIVIQKCSISRSSGLSCDSFNITSGSITLHIENSLDGNLVITKISEISYNNDSCKLNLDTLILAKNTTSLVFNEAGSIGTCKALLANPKIKAKINITYKDINLTSKTATGKLVAKIL